MDIQFLGLLQTVGDLLQCGRVQRDIVFHEKPFNDFALTDQLIQQLV